MSRDQFYLSLFDTIESQVDLFIGQTVEARSQILIRGAMLSFHATAAETVHSRTSSSI
jgi:hypothetical protein